VNFNDFLNFNKFVAPTLIRVVYWIGIAFIILGTLGAIAGGGMMASAMGGEGGGFNLFGALLALIGGACGLIVWRVVCEVWIVMFSINDRLGVLADRASGTHNP
jgi:hypothetical protein